MAKGFFSSAEFVAELYQSCSERKFRNAISELGRDALYYVQGSRVPLQIVWNVLPDNWKGGQPQRPFFVATHPDKSVRPILEYIHNGQVTVWEVGDFT